MPRARLAPLLRTLILAAPPLALAGLAIPACGQGGHDEPLDCSAEDLCEEVNSRYKEDVQTIVDSMSSCETREDCTSAVPTLGCDAQATWLTTCAQPIRADQVDAFHEAVAELEPKYCTECDLECHHDDEFACSAPIARCEEGRCVVEFMEDVVQ